MNTRSDTIAAISTPSGIGGIGIIRISGSQALNTIQKISRTSFNLLSLTTIKTRKLIHATITSNDQEKLDEVLIAFMPPQKSYTGEETIEIHCHGGRAILSLILERVLDCGCRIAKPGEFTQRAFQHRRINLIQAEAINEVIRARTGNAVKAAWRQFDGGLNDLCTELRKKLENIYIHIQTEIDFQIDTNIDIFKSIEEIEKSVGDLLKQSMKNILKDDGVWITLIGPANSGKSSLFNKILKSERAIVSNIPGTTTDYISEIFELEGKEIRITDTAGFKDPESEIQRHSIEKTIKQKKAANFILYILDQSADITPFLSDIEDVLNTNGIVIFNKSDLHIHYSAEIYRNKENCLFISTLYDEGIEELLNTIAKRIDDDFQESNISINIRQRQLLIKAKEEIGSIIGLKTNKNLDIVLYKIKQVIGSLSEIIGDISVEDTLNSVFSKFCIGK